MTLLQWSSARILGAATLFAVLGVCSGAVHAQAQLPDTPKDDSGNGNSIIDQIFDRQSNFKETPITSFPALPSNKNLMPFTLNDVSSLKYSIDSKSVSVSDDGVVRYTIVIDTPSGTRNIRYEGIHCASYRWRLYSGANSDGTAWDNASTPWARIVESDLNGYHAVLYNDYLCDNKMPAGKASTIVQNIRYNRSVRANEYRN